MPAEYSSRCKACNSPNRGQIESWKTKDKLNTSQIEQKLRETGEQISRKALDNHFAKHFDVQAEVREQYNQSQAAIQEAAGEGVAEIKILDGLISGKLKLHENVGKIISKRIGKPKDIENSEDLPKLPTSYVALYTGCSAGICQALKTKQELLGDDPESKKAKALGSWVDLMTEDK